MEKIEIYKKVKEDYEVHVHKDNLVIENYGLLLNPSKQKNLYWDLHHTYLNSSYEMSLTKEKKDNLSIYNTVFNKEGFLIWDNSLEFTTDLDYFF